jgi:drug/metabolite transporter (DMT)-like permease
MKYLSLLLVAIISGFFIMLIHWNAIMFGDIFQVWIRNFAALLLIIPIIMWKYWPLTIAKKEYWPLFWYSLLVAIAFITITLAYLNTDVKNVLAVRYFTSTCLSFFISLILLKEKSSASKIVALALVTLGLIIFAYPFNSMFTMGALYAFIHAASWIGFSLIIKKTAVNGAVILMLEFLAVSVLLGVYLVVVQPEIIREFSWLAIVAAGIFTILIMTITSLVVYGFRGTNFNIANIIMTSEIFFSLLFGYFFLQQGISSIELLGIIIIFIAAILPNVSAFIKSDKE